MYPVGKIDDHVKHIFTEHNQEADHLANLGTEAKTKITIAGVKSIEKWTAVRGYWDGSKNDDGRRGCGVVISKPSTGRCG